MSYGESLWSKQARQWNLLTPPLSPAREDLDVAQRTIDDWVERAGSEGAAAIVLGATPGLADLRWPPGSVVIAVDRSHTALTDVWPAPAPHQAPRFAVEADWRALPLAEPACDLVLADGSFANLTPEESGAFARRLARTLREDGSCCVRVFARPEQQESPATVWDELMDGRIDCFASFKLRLLMALCDPQGAVDVARAWEDFDGRGTSADEIGRRLGWPPEEISTIESYRDERAVYWFPTLAWFEDLFTTRFDVVEPPHFPTYPLGDRCPTFVAHQGHDA